MRSTASKSTPRRTEPGSTALPADPALRIAVLGSGLLGLVTAACMARFGHHITVIDSDETRVHRLRRGEPLLHELGLADELKTHLASGRLQFDAAVKPALAHATLVFLTIGSTARSDGSICLDALDAAVALIGLALQPDTIVVLSAGVPVGTARRVQAALEARAQRPRVLSKPEFLGAGSALADFMQPDRIIIGSDGQSETACATLLRAFRPLLDHGVPVLAMDSSSAELARCAASALLATRLSFVNEIAAIAAATGADIERVCEAIGADVRIGPDFLQAGLGYGGANLPGDVAALRHTARQHSLRSDMLHATERVNGRQRSWAFDALQRDLGGSSAMRGMRVAIWGLAFKPGTDDMCEAPSLALIERLLRAGVNLQLYDPAAIPQARAALLPDRRIAWADSAVSALEQADALMLVTAWPEFAAIDPQVVAEALRLRVVYDGRNALDLVRWSAAGIRVVQVGRPEGGRRMLAPRAAEAPEPASRKVAEAPSFPHAAIAAALR